MHSNKKQQKSMPTKMNQLQQSLQPNQQQQPLQPNQQQQSLQPNQQQQQLQPNQQQPRMIVYPMTQHIEHPTVSHYEYPDEAVPVESSYLCKMSLQPQATSTTSQYFVRMEDPQAATSTTSQYFLQPQTSASLQMPQTSASTSFYTLNEYRARGYYRIGRYEADEATDVRESLRHWRMKERRQLESGGVAFHLRCPLSTDCKIRLILFIPRTGSFTELWKQGVHVPHGRMSEEEVLEMLEP